LDSWVNSWHFFNWRCCLASKEKNWRLYTVFYRMLRTWSVHMSRLAWRTEQCHKPEVCRSYVCDRRLAAVTVSLVSTWRLQVICRVMDAAETAEVLGSRSSTIRRHGDDESLSGFYWHSAKSCELHVCLNSASVLSMTYIWRFLFCNAPAFSGRPWSSM
jgi:hypothetical protein